MNTQEILQVALECAGLNEVPADSGVVHPRAEVKRILTGIDITESEMLLAKELGIDTVFLHHPTGGRPRMGSSEVLLDQIPQMVRAGVPINKAQKALCKKRYGECIRRFHALNVTRSADAAGMLGLGMIACHTPADLVAGGGGGVRRFSGRGGGAAAVLAAVGHGGGLCGVQPLAAGVGAVPAAVQPAAGKRQPFAAPAGRAGRAAGACPGRRRSLAGAPR